MNSKDIKNKIFLYFIIGFVFLSGCAADVTTVPLSVTLDQSYIVLQPGETMELFHEIIPDEAAIKSVSWSSNNPEVATVSNGVITAIAEGSAIITVTTNSAQRIAMCELTVLWSVSGVQLDVNSAVMGVGENLRLSATVEPANAPNQSVFWESSDPEVIEVTDGTVIAKKYGTAIVTAISQVGGRTASCVVRVMEGSFVAMTAQVTSGRAIIRMSGSGTVEIDWGDGLPPEARTLGETYTPYSRILRGNLQSHTVVITGENITGLDCSDLRLTSLDVRRIETLTELNCSNSLLTNLDASRNSALIHLDCSNNLLTSLYVSDSPSLILISAFSNQLSTEAMNSLFNMVTKLPSPLPESHRYMNVSDNPGSQYVSTNLPNWHVITAN